MQHDLISRPTNGRLEKKQYNEESLQYTFQPLDVPQ